MEPSTILFGYARNKDLDKLNEFIPTLFNYGTPTGIIMRAITHEFQQPDASIENCDFLLAVPFARHCLHTASSFMFRTVGILKDLYPTNDSKYYLYWDILLRSNWTSTTPIEQILSIKGMDDALIAVITHFDYSRNDLFRFVKGLIKIGNFDILNKLLSISKIQNLLNLASEEDIFLLFELVLDKINDKYPLITTTDELTNQITESREQQPIAVICVVTALENALSTPVSDMFLSDMQRKAFNDFRFKTQGLFMQLFISLRISSDCPEQRVTPIEPTPEISQSFLNQFGNLSVGCSDQEPMPSLRGAKRRSNPVL